MKRITKSVLSIALAVVMTVQSTNVMAVSTQSDYMNVYNQGVDSNYQGTRAITATAVVSKLALGLIGRGFKEFGAACMKNDVPVLGTAFYFLADPSGRAQMQANAQVGMILQQVTEINNRLVVMQKSIDKIYEALEAYDLEDKFSKAQDNINKIYVDKYYKYYWEEYQKILTSIDELEDSDYENPETSTAYQKIFGKGGSYEDLMEEMSDAKFNADISTINDYIMNTDGTTTSYLSAYENMLRGKYPFEHQMSAYMYEAYQYTYNIQFQMLTLYQEYESYQYAKNHSSEDGEAKLPDNYFQDITNTVVRNLNRQAEESGIAKFILTPEYKEEVVAAQDELKTLKENGETLYPAEEFEDVMSYDATLEVNGKVIDTYYVRDNCNLAYYMIEKNTVKLNSDIQKWNNRAGKSVYRPNVALNYLRSADERYTLISSIAEIPALEKFSDNTGNDVRLLLRGNQGISAGFTTISEGMAGILLAPDTRKVPDGFDGKWNVSVLTNALEKKSYNSKDISDNKNGSGAMEVLRIYRFVDTNNMETLKYNDASYLNNQTILLDSGQKLDYSLVNADIKNLTIYAVGACEIIGNPKANLVDSTIYVSTDEQVKIKDVNIKTWQFGDAACIVKHADAKIELAGKNTFTGNGGTATGSIYTFYDYNNNPVGASQGLLVKNGASLTLSGGYGEFIGSCGGAGICTAGDITVTDANIKAVGSSLKVNVKQYYDAVIDRKEDDPHYLVGAGIGASHSVVKDQYMKDYPSVATYTSYGKIKIDKSTVVAQAGTVDASDFYAYDIGGFFCKTSQTYTNYGSYNKKTKKVNVVSNITNTVLTLENQMLDSKGELGTGNTYVKDTYTLDFENRYADYKNNPTVKLTDKDGNSVKLNGTYIARYTYDSNTTPDPKEDFVAKGLTGELEKITLSVDKSNKWFVDYVTVKSKFGKMNTKIYIGSWIGTNEKTFSINDHVAKVTIKVPDQKNAGTDSTLKLWLADMSKKSSSEFILDKLNRHGFERGKTETFYLNAKDLGKIAYVKMNSNQSGSSSGLKISSINVESVQGSGVKGDKFTMEVNQWILTKSNHVFGRTMDKTGAFKVLIKTSDVKKAGTDSNIQIKLEGEKGSTGYVNFSDLDNDSNTSHNSCERNDTDTAYMCFDTYGIGTLEKVHIKKDDAGSGPDWHVEKVEVTPIVANDETTTTFTFTVNSWIKKGEYSFETSTKTASLRGTRLDLHEFLTQTDEKSYLIKVNKGYVIEQEIVEYIQEQGICVTFEIYNEKGICFYSVIVDGTAINRAETINTALTIEKKDNIFAVFINDKKGLPSGVMVKINRSELQAELVDSNIVDEYKDLYVLEKSATAGFIKVKKITDDEEVVVDSFNSEGTAYLSHHEVYDEESEQDESDEDVSKDEELEQDESDEDVSKDEEPEQDESDEDTSKNEELSTEDTPATGDASNQTVYLLALLMLGMTIYVFGKKKKYDSV